LGKFVSRPLGHPPFPVRFSKRIPRQRPPQNGGQGGVPMPRPRFDPGSKWLLHNQARGVLRVGGVEDVRRYQAMPGEIVHSRKYPDGLLQVFLARETKPHHVLIEVATYPEKRALKQALDDLTLAYSALDHLPELLMLVLRPKGRFRIGGRHQVRSKLGLSRLEAEWRGGGAWGPPGGEAPRARARAAGRAVAVTPA